MDFNLLLRIINALTYTREIILAMGLLGNILSFVVFSRKTFANNSISVYCRALAIADCFGIVQFIYDIVTYQFNLDLAASSNFACKFFFFVTFGISAIPGWLLTAFSFDNMIQCLQLKKFTFLNEKKYQYLIIALVVAFNCALFTPMPVIMQVVTITDGNSSSTFCDLNLVQSTRFMHYVYVVETSFVPFGLMVISTLVIVRCLRNSRRRINLNQSSESSRRSKEFKFAFSSIFLNVLFIVLKTPLTFYYVLDIDNLEIGVIFLLSSVLCFYLNFSARFLFHFMSNSIFRNEFLRMIRVTSTNRQSNSSHTLN